MEQIKAFIEKIKSDQELREEVKRLAEQKADFAEVLDLAKNQGFVITKQDWESFARQALAKKEGELTDEQVAAVAGGGSTKDWIIYSIASFGVVCLYGYLDL